MSIEGIPNYYNMKVNRINRILDKYTRVVIRNKRSKMHRGEKPRREDETDKNNDLHPQGHVLIAGGGKNYCRLRCYVKFGVTKPRRKEGKLR